MKNKPKEHLSLIERDNLLRQPDKRKLQGLRDFCILALMLFTGLRRAEVCNLKRKDLKTQGKKMYLYILGKGNRQRKIPIKDPDLIFNIDRYFKKTNFNQNDDQAMFYKVKFFRMEKPGPITPAVIRHMVKKYIETACLNKRITPHTMRHTFLSLALQNGASLATCQALAGHQNIQTTSLYLHTTEEQVEKAIESLSS